MNNNDIKKGEKMTEQEQQIQNVQALGAGLIQMGCGLACVLMGGGVLFFIAMFLYAAIVGG